MTRHRACHLCRAATDGRYAAGGLTGCGEVSWEGGLQVEVDRWVDVLHAQTIHGTGIIIAKKVIPNISLTKSVVIDFSVYLWESIYPMMPSPIHVACSSSSGWMVDRMDVPTPSVPSNRPGTPASSSMLPSASSSWIDGVFCRASTAPSVTLRPNARGLVEI